jgi:putative SOS response-associated peptidase YedK
MCGRYSISKAEILAETFEAELPSSPLFPNYNAVPRQSLPVILNDNPQQISLSVWGFLPEWAHGKSKLKPVINAPSETVAPQPLLFSPPNQMH